MASNWTHLFVQSSVFYYDSFLLPRPWLGMNGLMSLVCEALSTPLCLKGATQIKELQFILL